MEEQLERIESVDENVEWQAPPPPEGKEPVSARRKKSYLYGALAAIGFGIILLVLGLTQILPGIESGGMLAIFGVVLLGLSFIPFPEKSEKEVEQAPMSPVERLTKIFYAPVEVFQNLRRHPNWLTALLIMSILGSAYHIAFTQRLTAKRIVDHTISKLEQSGFGMPPTAIEQSRTQQTEQLTQPSARVGTAIQSFAGWFIAYAFVAAIFLLIVLAMGGTINFWQAFAAVVYAAFPVTIIRYLLNFIILFVKDPKDIHPLIGQQTLVQDNLGALVNPADSAVLWVLLSSIGILSFYSLWLEATGLKNTGERVSSSAAWTAAIIFWILWLSFGVLGASLLPGFFS